MQQNSWVSLNKQTLQGPDLTKRLFRIIQRFRKWNHVQVKVTPKHRNGLRLLWWAEGDLSKDPDIYRMTVHPFGGAQAVLHRHFNTRLKIRSIILTKKNFGCSYEFLCRYFAHNHINGRRGNEPKKECRQNAEDWRV